MPETRPCSCDWADCSVYSERIAKHAPDDHPWKRNSYRWRIKVDKGNQCFEKMMLLSAICHHIPAIANKVAEGSQSFVLARHHFPVSAFDHIGGQKMAVLLSEKEIKTLHMREELCSTMATGGFSQFLIKHTLLPEYAKLSVGTGHDDYFKSVIEGKDPTFDTECQHLVRMCWENLDDALEAATNNYQRMYHFHVYEDLCTQMVAGERKFMSYDKTGVSILYLLISKLVMRQVKVLLRRHQDLLRSRRQRQTVEKPDWRIFQKYDVNRFVGWALYSLRCRIRKGKRIASMDEDEEDLMIDLMSEMSVKEIVDDESYLQEYYPLFDRLYNEGGLTLMAPKYIGLGHKILIAIAQQIHYDKMLSDSSHYVEKARDAVAESVEKELLPEFLHQTAHHDLREDLRKLLFIRLVRKTFNARMGAFIRQHKTETVARGTQGHTIPLRDVLKIASGPNTQNKKVKL